jgi:hypothetical protein
MGDLNRRLDRLEGRCPPRCRGCSGVPVIVLIDGLGPRPAIPTPCPECGTVPFVIEAVKPAGAS